MRETPNGQSIRNETPYNFEDICKNEPLPLSEAILLEIFDLLTDGQAVVKPY